MKGILEFELPGDQEDFDMAQAGWKWKRAMRELDEYLRGKLKHGDLGDIQGRIYEIFRRRLHDCLEEQDLTLD